MEPTPVYITKEGERFGPFPSDQIMALVENGHFAWDDLAWRDGFDEWTPLDQVYEGLGAVAVATPPKPVHPVDDDEKARSFFGELLLAFVYPFRGEGAWVILLFGVILSGIFAIIRYAFLLGLIASVFLIGYCVAFYFKIIMETAIGEQDVAELPGFQDTWEGVLRPFFQVLFAVLACLLPAIVAGVYVENGSLDLVWLPLALVAGGMFYLPMVLLATVIFNSLPTALNPILVVPAISRIFLRYLVIVFFLGVSFVGYGMASDALSQSLHWFVAYPVVTLVTFYLGIIQSRMLGLIYRTSSGQIGWFNH